MDKQVFIIYGENDFTRHQALRAIKGEIERNGPPDALTGNLTELDGSRLKAAELQNACSVIPFMAEKRLVIVHGLLGRFEASGAPSGDGGRKRPAAADIEEWRGFSEFAGHMPPSTVLVLLDGALKEASNALFLLLKPVSEPRLCPALKKGELVRTWIRGRAKDLGAPIADGAVGLLEQLVGNDLWTLDSEISKLAAYCSGKPISEDAVRLLVCRSREESMFALADAILEGQVGLAQRMLSRLLDAGESPLGVLALVNRQLRLVVRAKALPSSLPRGEAEARLGIRGWTVDKTLKMASSYSWVRLKTVYRKLVETDLSIKTGKCGGDLALVLLISELGAGQDDKRARIG